MARTRVKLCGMMTATDAIAAAAAGADAIGMILHADAKRKIGLDTARDIVAVLPPFVTPVGVVVDAGDQRVFEIASRVGLTTFQFHGNETPADVAAVKPLYVIKVIKCHAATIRQTLDRWRDAHASDEADNSENLKAILLEAPTTAAGGSGEANDFDLIESLQAEGAFDNLPPIIIAGGLRPDNVAAVVRRLRPYAVDVSTGIEETFGRKSSALMKAFVENATNP